MKKLIILFCFIFISCTTKYIKAPYNLPPEKYTPNKITTENEFLLEYRSSLMKIKEWEQWYNIQVGTNFF